MTGVRELGVGSIAAIWRYPAKSMPGEDLDAAEVGERGLLGDRAYALLDADTGAIASPANPRKWAALYDCRASYEEQPHCDQPLPPVRVTLPNGETVASTQRECDAALTHALGRAATLVTTLSEAARFELYWPAIAGLVPVGDPVPDAEQVTCGVLPPA